MKRVNNNISNKIINNKGFTLVELLAVIAILAIVSVIVVLTVTNVVDESKKKSYMVTINNIEKYSETYVIENDNNIKWYDFGNDSLYQCVTVENLIDMGYFSNDILDSKVSENRNVLINDYIFIEKDKNTKSIKKYKLLYDNTVLNGWCGDYINAIGNISFNIENANKWTQSKNILITYNLDTSVGNTSNYKYGYLYDAYNINNEDKDDFFDFHTLGKATKSITVNDNGKLYAKILGEDDETIVSNSTNVGKIDIARPVVSLGSYTGEKVVRGSVTIPIELTDKQNSKDGLIDGSGVDNNSVELNDFVVSIGGNELTSGVSIDKNNYNLTIENYDYPGELKIVVNENKILDKVGYGNEKVELKPGITFSNQYKISYDANGGTGSMDDTICTYDSNCTLRGSALKRTGYTFKGWDEGKNATTSTYSDKYEFKPFNLKKDIKLYAVWQKNRVYVQYNVNGGTISSKTIGTDGIEYNWTTDSSGIIKRNGVVLNHNIVYGTQDDPANYNYEKYINITKNGYVGKSGEEWICLSDNCKRDTYSHIIEYPSDEYCDVSEESCTVVLGVNWIDGEPPTAPTILLNSYGDIVFKGSKDNITSSDKIIYKGSITNSNFVTNFKTPTSNSGVYAVAVDEVGNTSNSSHKNYIIENARNGSVVMKSEITGYKCTLDNKVYTTKVQAEIACTYTDTKDTESTTKYYCKTGYTYSSSTNKCEKSGTITTKYYCSNTKKYQNTSVCASKTDQDKCETGWTASNSSNCSFTCSYANVLKYAKCFGRTSCSGGTRSCTSTCSDSTDPYCVGGYTMTGDPYCSALKQLYNCKLYGSKSYYCSLTEKYTTTEPSCKEVVNLSSYQVYSCPDGYTTTDTNITSTSKCTKTLNASVTQVTSDYFSCSLFPDNKYNTEDNAKNACSNYCSNSLTRYYSGKNKCIGLK